MLGWGGRVEMAENVVLNSKVLNIKDSVVWRWTRRLLWDVYFIRRSEVFSP